MQAADTKSEALQQRKTAISTRFASAPLVSRYSSSSSSSDCTVRFFFAVREDLRVAAGELLAR